MNPLGKKIIVLIMLWVFLFMVVQQIYDNVTGRGQPVRAQASATAQTAANPDPTIQAIADAQSCVTSNPNDVDCLEQLGNLYYGLGQYQQAQSAFEAAVKLDPHNVNTLVKLAGCYIRGQDFEKALPTLEQAVTLQPNSPELHLLLGLALDKADPPQTPRAIDEWRQVIKLAPGSQWATQAQQYLAEKGVAP
jgi:cytochrome c-type biogenesis protein CcmH/NrfG